MRQTHRYTDTEKATETEREKESASDGSRETVWQCIQKTASHDT